MTFLEEVIDDVGFGPDDQNRLQALHPILAPHFPAIAVELYEVVAAKPRVAAILSSPERTEHLHARLIEWLSSGLVGPWDERFYASRARVGGRHLELGLPQQFILVAMSVVRAAYLERISVLLAPPEAFATIRAVNKLLDLELAIIQHTYQLDTEQRLAARERRQRADQLEAMQTLSSGLAHELRNPLNAAKLQLELLVRRLRRQLEDRALSEPTELVGKEIERLAALVSDFLTFAKPPELAPALQDFVPIVEHVIELERPLAARRGIELRLEVQPPSIPARVDAEKVQKVVQNLVRNAVEAVSLGGHVEVRVSQEADRVHVCVIDDGPGIPDRLRARIFEPFFTTKDSGTGLGMSIVQSLVAIHGGTIEVASSPAGTHFDIALPRAA